MGPKYFTAQDLEGWAKEDPPRLLQAALIQIGQLQTRSDQLRDARAQIKVKDQRIAELETLLEKALSASLRQAAPFRVPQAKRTAMPKAPGRKAGHPGACRAQPAQIDQEITVELSACPHCGQCRWTDQKELEQFIEDIPVLQPRVTRLRTYEATCAGCGQRSCSGHPMQVSQAAGAAGVHLGARALAIAADLNKAKGLSMRKTCAVLQDHLGLRLTQGGLSQALCRVAHKVQPQYLQIRDELLKAPALHVDETSWWVGGSFCWLWVFTHPKATFYLIAQSRGRTVLETVLGKVFPGVLVSDCLSTYDREEGLQQKCFAHHLKAISHAKEIHPKNGEGFLTQIEALLKRALTLGQQKAADCLHNSEFLHQRQLLESQAMALLNTEPRELACEESVRQRLAKQRDHLFVFLDHEGVAATNNLAERQLRQAVIARKISCGNKTRAGADAFQILASLAATCAQIGSSFIQRIAVAVLLNSS
jgi:transposase